MSRKSKGPLTLLIDTNNLVARIYYGLGAKSSGLDSGAEVRTIRAKIQQLIEQYQPEYVLAGIDSPDLFRQDLDGKYKYKGGAGKRADPEALAELLRNAPQTMQSAGAVPVQADRHEADDVIATLVRQAPGDVVIVSGDRDLYTLLRDGVQVFDLDSKTLVSEADVTEKYHGVPPRLLPFFQALRGDLRAKKLRRKMFAPRDAARLTVAYETPRRLFGALGDLSDADQATLAHTTLENLEQNVALHTLNDHAPTVLATGLTAEGV